ncbi:MAG: hypothetical protein V4714_08660 [Bacteroidota bacterium]
MKKSEPTLAKTLIPNSVIIWVVLYLTIVVLMFTHAENWRAPLLYTILLAGLIYLAWLYRNKFDCRLILSESEFLVYYYNPSISNKRFELKQIKSNIKLERYYIGEQVRVFPHWRDYINYKWYFISDKYRVTFYSGDQNTLIDMIIQPNIIGFQKFMKKLVKSTNLAIDSSQPANSYRRDAAEIFLDVISNFLN